MKFEDKECALRDLSTKIHERTDLIAGDNYQIVNEPIYVGILQKITILQRKFDTRL